ncbi:hypothetical protein [Variovorax ginsengisoli]|uniref:Uncharacterized protein n=1 Tax=Variovorax ginsengisoli TaxID=363844 RepID=A0ABT8SC12_9BURK|nr:hypothetical protein [Variovorax ginsengisoli]MDN8617287.1 hypothetical protein [Variovorax ginsengisoli]MDO1536457.1 hypothetical protein [Variovorax ginsengisoli]
MIHCNASELNVRSSRNPLPALEVKVDSLEERDIDFCATVAKALADFVLAHPDAHATVYLYGTMSVNFHEPAWSEFLIPLGDKRLMQVLEDAFRRLGDVPTRQSDYVSPAQGSAMFHLEGGHVWEPEDALTWLAREAQDETSATVVEDDSTGPATTDDSEGQDWDLDIPMEGAVAAEPRRSEQPTRFRQARADARVGTIKREIERVFGLPAGSVVLRGGDGAALRSDAFIRTLRSRW